MIKSLLVLVFVSSINSAKSQILENINIVDYRPEAHLFESDSTFKAKTVAMLSDRKKIAPKKEDKWLRPFVQPEQMPQFPGGDKKLIEYIAANQRLIDPFVEGQVIVRFTVDKDSIIKEAKVLRGLSEEADAEALRIINSMPKWIPGRNNNKNVAMDYTLPVRFKLAKPRKEKRQKTKTKNKNN